MKILNVYGSTGTIGNKTLKIVDKFFPNIKINLLVANKNYIKLAHQAKKYNSTFVCINDESKLLLLKKKLIKTKVKIIRINEIDIFLKSSISDLSLLSISGYSALYFIENIIINTKNLGIVNKESIVSAGHIIKNLCKKYNTTIFAIDSEHFSIQNFFNKPSNNIKNIKNLYLTASGGPFLNKKFDLIKNVSFKKAINHPKWKMGYKNSIDSATLVNKCMEIIEAHYLFNIDYDRLKIKIHPEALVHSIIEYNNHTSFMNYFYHDMIIPILNFLNLKKSNNFIINKFNFPKNIKLNFYEPQIVNFPILKLFNKIDKSNPRNLIKFNIGNELAVDLFANKNIKFYEISKIIKKSMLIDVDYKINNISNILRFQDIFINKLKLKLNIE